VTGALVLALTIASPSADAVNTKRVSDRVKYERSFGSLYRGYLIDTSIDAASTGFFRLRGAPESNPLMRNPWVLVSVKMVIEPLFLATLDWLAQKFGHYRTARVLRLGSRIIHAGVGVHNIIWGLKH
jgi:hypothetical protein